MAIRRPGGVTVTWRRLCPSCVGGVHDSPGNPGSHGVVCCQFFAPFDCGRGELVVAVVGGVVHEHGVRVGGRVVRCTCASMSTAANKPRPWMRLGAVKVNGVIIRYITN